MLSGRRRSQIRTCSKDLSPASLPSLKISSWIACFTSWKQTVRKKWKNQWSNVVLEKPDLKIKCNKISPHYCTGQRGVLQSLSSWSSQAKFQGQVRRYPRGSSKNTQEAGGLEPCNFLPDLTWPWPVSQPIPPTCKLSPWTNIWATGTLRL